MSRRIQIFVRFVDGSVSQMIQQLQRNVPAAHMRPTWPSFMTNSRHYYSSSTVSLSSSTNPATSYIESPTPSTATDPTIDGLKETVPITYIEANGKERLVQAEIGKHLLDVAHDNHVELEGACGGELSCSTCHLIFETHVYEKLSPKLDDEQDMLDLAFGVTETSRLGCQIRVTKELEGIKVQIPDDGF